eukprot:gene12181-15507_t
MGPNLVVRRFVRLCLAALVAFFLPAAAILALLEGDLWLDNARAANAAAAELAAAAGDRLMHPVEADEVFLVLAPAEAAALRAQGFDFYDWNAPAG